MSELSEEEKQKLKEMLDTWDTTSRAIKVIKGIGIFVKWCVYIGGGIAAMWTALHGGAPK